MGASDTLANPDLEKGQPPATLQPTELHPDNVVDYDGPDDPENPFNWPRWKKGRQLVLMAFNTFITYVSLLLCFCLSYPLPCCPFSVLIANATTLDPWLPPCSPPEWRTL